MLDAVALRPCYYCGLVANTIDHVPPLVARPHIAALGLKGRYPFVTVPACHECNSGLGARALWTIPARKRWVKQWLTKRYRKYLNLPAWDDGELSRLGLNLRGHVLAGLEKQRVIRERLRW